MFLQGPIGPLAETISKAPGRVPIRSGPREAQTHGATRTSDGREGWGQGRRHQDARRGGGSG
eukprot:9345539-Pyramimonas_sp.AAC.1